MDSRWMKRGIVPGAIAAIVLATAGQASAASLHDQFDNLSDHAANSQEYETALDLDRYTAEAADDFTVPVGQSWSVNLVDFGGVYYDGTGPANSFTIRIYENGAGNVPGDLVSQQFNLPYSYTPATHLFTTAIAPVSLDPGNYWLSVQARQDLSDFGRFGWLDRGAQSGRPAVFENPQNGGGTGCTSWTVRTACDPDSAAAPDQAFALSGTSTPIPAPGTQITGASVDQRKRKAKLSFSGTGRVSGFECALVRHRAAKAAKFKSCRSPKTYRHVSPGRYDFSVRAVGPGGKDASPATKRVKIKE